MDYKNINDYEQIYLIKENDDEAKDIMFKKYRPIVFGIATRYYQKMIHMGMDLDDIVQEGYIGLSNAINCFSEDNIACFYTFCTVCIERQIKAYCRKFLTNKGKFNNSLLSIDNDSLDNQVIYIKEDETSLNNPDVYLASLYDYIECIHFKNSLEGLDSCVFELRCNGFKYKEISRLLDISCSRVDTIVHKLKENYRKYINK